MLQLRSVVHFSNITPLQNVFYGLSKRFKAYRPEDSEPKVVLSKDERTVICWHPEKSFPYEYSLPLPEEKVEEHNSVLKVQSSAQLRQLYRPKKDDLVRQELMAITYTTKHRWFPCNRRFKERKIEYSRRYL